MEFRISKFFKKRNFRYARSLMKGYRMLNEQNRLSLIYDVKNSLTNTPLIKLNSNAFIFKGEPTNGYDDLIIRQYLVVRLLMDLSFHRSVLYSIGTNTPIIHPLPRAWQKKLNELGLETNSFYCNLLFFKKTLFIGFSALFEFFNLIKCSIFGRFRKLYKDLGVYIFFADLNTSSLPVESGNYKYGIISTYLLKFPRLNDLNTICHTVRPRSNLKINEIKLRYIKSPIPPASNSLYFLIFFLKSCFWILWAIIDFMRLHWITMFFLREKIKALGFRHASLDMKAKQYFFHNSEWIYRPLWTYEAVKGGAEVSLYFYSTNIERFKQKGCYPDISNSWTITTWPSYITWDKYQNDFIKRASKFPNKIYVVGSISFNFSTYQFIHKTEEQPFVAVFDIQPLRDTFFIQVGSDLRYYIPDVATKFLKDIMSVSASLNCKVVVKRKREIGKHLNSEYRNQMRNLENMYNCIFADPSAPAEEIIQKSIIVISMPFTSTAIIAKEMGKPTIYYDPLGIIEKDDRAAHGILILHTKEQLRKWMECNYYLVK